MIEQVIFFGAGLPGMPATEGGTEGTTAGTVAPPPGTGGGYAAQPEPEPFSIWPMLLIWGGVFVAMWFFMIRPQRKREKQMKELQSQITVNDNVVTSGGFFGKVADVGEDCFIVEFGTNRGIRIPVLKADVVAVRSPKMTPQAKESSDPT
ncbi:MAG: preprotein translocase subunit YajC [Defluviitaleaceae bacterium]|nr:preprotein translocase subunit YajC [Defluviitaleaceae bacterium]